MNRPATLLCLIALALLAAACSRPRAEERIVRETVPVAQTVLVRETVVVERIVEVTPTPDPSRQPVTLRLHLGGEPYSIEPPLASDPGGLEIVENLFLGLTRVDAQGNIQPELATEWRVATDGLRWTFTLRDDVPWVNYRPGSGVTAAGQVTADDVVYAVRRACDPRTGAAQAAPNYIIAGCQALHTADPASSAGEFDALAQAVGVEALDATTVQFTLTEPAGYFPAVASLPLNRPLPQRTVERYGDRWTEPGNIVSNGPYALAGWFHGDSMALERNPLWPGWPEAGGNVARIELAMLPDAEALALYQAGELDSVAAPPAEMARVRADPQLSRELTVVPISCSEYYGFDASRAPTDNALVRRALSAAIDRQALVQTITRGGELPANTFAPSGVFGSAAGDPTIAPWAVDEAQGGWGYPQSLAQARAWLAEAGYPGGEGLPPLTLLHNNADGPAQAAQAVAAMWRDGLGIEVEVESLAWPEYSGVLNGLGQETGPSNAGGLEAGPSNGDMPHVWRMGFCGDLPDQRGWLEQEFSAGQGVDRLRWAEIADAPLAGDGRSFNQLTAAARQSADPAERRALYREAERLVTDTAAVIAPLFYYSTAYLTKPHVQRSDDAVYGSRFAAWRVD